MDVSPVHGEAEKTSETPVLAVWTFFLPEGRKQNSPSLKA
jgi:hypothetical protein